MAFPGGIGWILSPHACSLYNQVYYATSVLTLFFHPSGAAWREISLSPAEE